MLEELVQSRQELWGRLGYGGKGGALIGVPFPWDLKASPGEGTQETLTPDVQVEVLLRAARLVESLTGVVACIPRFHSVHLARSKDSWSVSQAEVVS